MAKWCGKIGYGITEETEPGVWEQTIVEKKYYGDSLNLKKANVNSGDVNDNVIVNNSISILADPFARNNFCNMLYVEFMGVKWKIDNVTVKYPRLELSLGGVYNA